MIFLIVLSNFSVLAIDPIAAGERIAVTITLLLTLVAFKFVLLEGTPKVGYLTYMDRYVVGAFAFLVGASFENIIISPLTMCLISSDDDCGDLEVLSEDLREPDATFQLIYAAVWTVVNIYITLICFIPSLVRDKWDSVLDNQIGETEKTVQRTRRVYNSATKTIVLAQKPAESI